MVRPVYSNHELEEGALENKRNSGSNSRGCTVARPSPRDRYYYHQLYLVRTRDKVRCIHTINMNWTKHKLSECTRDVRQLGSNAVHALSCDQSLFMIDHVSTEV